MSIKNSTNISNSTGKIYVLSVGIDKYKSGRIRDLNGCVKDCNRLAGFLQGKMNVSAKNYRIIKNEEASRQGIIDTFRSHFKDLKDGDIALFHYSGHGSWEYTTQDFIQAKLEPAGGRNELLICHDSGEEGVFDLADKELRMLIAEIQFPEGEAAKDIHFVGLFDCCHSGSILRKKEESIRVRMSSSSMKERPLEAYLNGKYIERYQENGKLVLPMVNYISLTACSPKQSAIEDSRGGIFTNALIDCLSSNWTTGNSLTYVELFSLVREFVKQNTYNNQTPYFEYTGKVNPYHCFLMQGESSKSNYPELLLKDGLWKVNIGAIHGVDQEGMRNFRASIFEKKDLEHPIGIAQIEVVELEYTQVTPCFFENHDIKKDRTYFVAINGRQLPIMITAKPIAHEAYVQIQKELEKPKNKNRFLLSIEANYELKIEHDTYSVYQRFKNEKKLIYEIRNINALSPQHIITQLNKIARWEQINCLQSPRNASIDSKNILFEFHYKGENKHKDVEKNNQENFTQVEVDFDPNKGGIPYWIEIENKSNDDLWFYLIHLDRKFGVSQKNENYLKKFIARGNKMKLYDSYSKGAGLGISDETKEILDIYLLIASKEALAIPYVFEQGGLGENYGKVINQETYKTPEKIKLREELLIKQDIKVNWVIKRLEVKVTRV